MMKFHPFSFAVGVGTAAVLMSQKQHLRPVIVEIAALGLHLGRLGLSLVERQREQAEDLWAEVEERARHKARGNSGRVAPGGDGAGSSRAERPS